MICSTLFYYIFIFISVYSVYTSLVSLLNVAPYTETNPGIYNISRNMTMFCVKHTMSSSSAFQNVEAKVLREPSLEAPRRGAEVKDDDPIIPFGPQPTVSRFGAISRTSKTGYQTTVPVQAMASTPQNANSKHIAMPGRESCLMSLSDLTR